MLCDAQRCARNLCKVSDDAGGGVASMRRDCILHKQMLFWLNGRNNTSSDYSPWLIFNGQLLFYTEWEICCFSPHLDKSVFCKFVSLTPGTSLITTDHIAHRYALKHTQCFVLCRRITCHGIISFIMGISLHFPDTNHSFSDTRVNQNVPSHRGIGAILPKPSSLDCPLLVDTSGDAAKATSPAAWERNKREYSALPALQLSSLHPHRIQQRRKYSWRSSLTSSSLHFQRKLRVGGADSPLNTAS